MSPEDAIRAQAQDLGFDICGLTGAEPPRTVDQFNEWLRQGRHGEMEWMARTRVRRTDPQTVLPGVRSIVVVGAAYEGAPWPSRTGHGSIACYARHADYHDVLGEKLERLARFINQLGGSETRSLWYTDTGPVLERDLAERAGIGFIGKHTNLINRSLGNWLLLGEILTTLELPADAPEKNRCGKCVRCLEACPTKAITAPFQLDARLCISYLTIELKGSIPLPLRPLVGGRVFGCDDCLAVCPWNRFARAGRLMRAHQRADLATPDLLAWLDLDEAGFKARFAGTPIFRLKRRGLLRNICVALGNVGDRTCLPPLEKASADPEPLIAEHARWAGQRILERLAPALAAEVTRSHPTP
jgi:epoxyqueuosine reductase